MENTWTILSTFILGIAVIAGPIVTLQLSSHNAAVALELQYQREDSRAARLEKATQEVAKKVEVNSRQVNTQLEGIAKTTEETHVLVNSSYTASKQSERDSIARSLTMMYEVVELRKSLGQAPSQVSLSEIEATKVKLEALDTELKARR